VPAPSRSSPAPLPSTVGATLLEWFRRHRRPLPWRRRRTPYRIWVAEVILQQTRVEPAIPYYERFVREFPTVRALAAAPLDRVLKVWEGAGYYARARHLHVAARVLVRDRSGRLPATVDELEELPGIGPYIARAVASLAFDVPTVALEANGLRVGARWILEEGDIRAGATRRRIETALTAAMAGRSPGAFNEAIMELGETVCRPIAPRCERCPVAFACGAYRELEDPGTIPRPQVRARRPHVRAAVVLLEDGRGRWLVQRRPPRGLLGGLWELPGGKIRSRETAESAAERELREETGGKARSLTPIGVVRHAYSHFTVELHVFLGRARLPLPAPGGERRWVTLREIRDLPIPKATEKVLSLLRSGRPGRASRGSGSRRGRTSASRSREVRPRAHRALSKGTGS